MERKRAEQFYPTYHFSKGCRDVVLLEFEEAQKIANGQTKVYGQVANILLGIVTILIPLVASYENIKYLANLLPYSLLLAGVAFVFGALSLRYFVDLQKQITINARKVVTLRAMLGLDYGNIHLTIPNWRVEGASNPFKIKYFNGWLKFQSMPFWVLTIGVNAIWHIVTNEKPQFVFHLLIDFSIPWFIGNFLITLSYLLIFRTNLNDTHESSFMNLGKIVARLLRFKLVDNFEYILYRAKLSVVETERLSIDYSNLKSILVKVEDKDFWLRGAISVKALIRGFASQIPPLKKRLNLIESGGSTITMQLSRTLFIIPNQNKYIRKFFEIWISIWLNSRFTKKEIIDLYIASVRYDYGIMGLPNAIKHFFRELKNKKLSLEESFVLVERLSNVTSTFNEKRVDFLMQKVDNVSESKVKHIYSSLLERKVISYC